MGLLTSALSLLTGGLVKDLVAGANKAWADKLAADTSEKKLEADKQIAFFEGQIALATTAASEDAWYSPRSLMGYCATIYVAKIVVWDTVWKLGVTPDPGPQVTGLVLTIVGFYYGSATLSVLGTKVLAAFTARKR